MKDNPVAKNAHKFNKAQVHKDRKKAEKKGDRKHKGRYEDSGDIEERSTLDAISSVLKRNKDRGKYQAALKAVKSGKYKLPKAAQVFDVSPKVLQDLVSEERNYKKEYENYHSRPEQKKRRAARNGARRMLKDRKNIKGMDVHHKDNDPMNNDKSNLSIVTQKYNRTEPRLRKEDVGKKEPTNPKLWAKFKAQAKSEFDVYPSAYANGWAAKQYKAAGGGWKTVKEEEEVNEGECWDTHKKVGTKMKNGKRVNDCVPKNENVEEGMYKTGNKGSRKLGNRSNRQSPDQDKYGGANYDPKKAKTRRKIDNLKHKRELDRINKDFDYDFDEGTSAQSRLDRAMSKRDLGKTNTAASDYEAKLMKKYGAKDLADLKKKMGMKEDGFGFIKPNKPQRKSSDQRAKPASPMKKTFAKISKSLNAPSKTVSAKAPAPKKTKISSGKPLTSSMDPRDFTDNAGFLVAVKDRKGNEEIKRFFNTKPAAQKYADLVKNTNKVGHVATIYKTDGRKMMKESNLHELTQRELEKIAARKQKNLVKRGKAKAEPKAAGRAVNTGRGGRQADDSSDNLIMQLRKAKDLRGNHDIKFKGGKTKLPLKMIDKLLNTYDKIQKPADRKKFETLVTHELRKKEGLAPQRSQTASDKAMAKFNKSRARGIPSPRGKKSGPSDNELRDIERGK
jgi:hypothetical protein